jgi:hypothetical protein
MNKEQQELLDEVYENYRNSYPDAEKTFQYEKSTFETRRMTKDEFIDMVKSDVEYGRRWGLKIEERELSLEERHQLALPIWKEKYGPLADMMVLTNVDNTPYKIPRKIITITYNNETIESYE